MSKLSQNNIERKSRPFVDKDLQFQFPCSSSENFQISYNPIYSHYMSSYPVVNFIMPNFNEMELSLAMKEAEQAFHSWTKLKKQLEVFKETSQ